MPTGFLQLKEGLTDSTNPSILAPATDVMKKGGEKAIESAKYVASKTGQVTSQAYSSTKGLVNWGYEKVAGVSSLQSSPQS